MHTFCWKAYSKNYYNMDENVKNKIDGQGRPLKEVMANKFVIEYFQRDYTWERRHIDQLLYDLNYAFFESYKSGDTIDDVMGRYNSYFMGPYIVYQDRGSKSLIDGQQRITSLSLLFIYIMNEYTETKKTLMDFVYKDFYGKVSFNLQIKDRYPIMEYLLNHKNYDDKDLTVSNINLLERYGDIEELFPEQLKNHGIISLFVCWLCEKVTFVEILAYSDENAYSIFETMNDRGCNLTAIEMMKSFLLSKIRKESDRNECTISWNRSIGRLLSVEKDMDSEFMRALLRGKYATFSKESNDFEAIGTTFHRWVKSNMELMGLNTSSGIKNIISNQLDFYSRLFVRIRKAEKEMCSELYLLNAQSTMSIAPSLIYPLYFAAVNMSDLDTEVNEKINAIAKAIDCFSARRVLEGKPITQTSVRGFIQDLILKTRNKDLKSIQKELRAFVEKYAPNFCRVSADETHSNKTIRYLHYRINLYLNRLVDPEYVMTYSSCRGKRLQSIDDDNIAMINGVNAIPIFDMEMVGKEKNSLYGCLLDGNYPSTEKLPRIITSAMGNSETNRYDLFNALLVTIWGFDE